MPGGVTGRGDDFPLGLTEVDRLLVVERLVNGVGGDGLVEVLGEAAARVAAPHGVGVGRAGRDSSAGGLQRRVAADVVGVPVGVDHQLDAPACVCFRPVAGLVGVADEPGVDQRRSRAGEEQEVGVGERPGLP